MPTSARGDGPRAVHMLIDCRHGCGLIGGTPSYDVTRKVAQHFHSAHNALGRENPTDTQRIVENVDFTVSPAPNRCDMCNEVVELPWWTHIADPPMGVMAGTIVDQDGRWLLCDTCHGYAEGKDVDAAVARNMEISARQSPGAHSIPGLADQVRAETREMFALLFERLDPGRRLVA